VRPIARAKAKAKRLRRRPDPFATVSEQLRAWFDAEPKQTGRALLPSVRRERPDALPARAASVAASFRQITVCPPSRRPHPWDPHAPPTGADSCSGPHAVLCQ
jgi:hypothetical protein